MAALLAGQAATLRLIEAGPVVGYQHFVTFSRLGDHPLAVGVLLVELVAVSVGLWRQWKRRVGGRGGRTGRRVATVAIALCLLSAFPSREPVAYLSELALGGALQMLHLGAVALAVLALPTGWLKDTHRAFSSRLGGGFVGRPRVDRFALVVAATTTVVAAVLAVVVYERHPHVPDEVAYLLHARYLAEGSLAMPAPPVPEAFDVDLMMIDGDRWFAPAPPGWPAVLAIGVAAGAPWLVNPVLGGLGVLLTYLLLGGLYDRQTARFGILLLATSPWYLFLSMSFMNHLSSLVAALAAGCALARWASSGRAVWPLVAGAFLGVVGLIRPLEAVIVGGVLAMAMLSIRNLRRSIAGLALLAAGAATVSAAVLPYNAYLTGSPTHFPIMYWVDSLPGNQSNALGFGADRGLGWTGLDPYPGHGARDVVVNSLLNSVALNIELLGWATGSLVAVLAFAGWGRWRSADRLMAMAAAAVVVVHAAYWFAGGPDFGPRYWFLLIVPLVALSARGAVSLGTGDEARGRVAAAMLGLAVGAIVLFIPWRAVDKYHHYRGMRPDVRELAVREGFGSSLVLVRGRRHPDFASAAAYNPVDLGEAVPVYAWWDGGADQRRALEAAFPGRRVFVIEGPSVTGSGYRIAERPSSTARANRVPPRQGAS